MSSKTIVLLARPGLSDKGKILINPHSALMMNITMPTWCVFDDTVDCEDSAENFAKLYALDILGYDVAIGYPMDNRSRLEFYRLGDVSASTVDNDAPFIWGMPTFLAPLHPDVGNTLYQHPAMINFLDRTMAIFASPDDSTCVGTIVGTGEHVSLQEFCEGQRRFVKQAGGKGFSQIINFPQKSDVIDVIFENLEDFGGYYLPTLNVQSVVHPIWETRFFVVNNTIITSSGRIVSEFPKFDNNASGRYGIEQFSDGLHDDNATVNPYFDIMFDYAQHIVDNMSPTGESLHYVLDVAMHDDDDINAVGTPFVVETNGLSNSGLYGCDIMALAEAYALDQCDHPNVTIGELWSIGSDAIR